jgi:hypothetical protein
MKEELVPQEFEMMFDVSPNDPIVTPEMKQVMEALTHYFTLYHKATRPDTDSDFNDLLQELQQQGKVVDQLLGQCMETIGDPTLSCHACGNQAMGKPLQRCSKCKQVYYCSTTCQKHAWKILGHKRSCQSPTPKQLDAFVRTRYKTLRRQGKDVTTAMTKARQDYGIDSSNTASTVNPGQQVAAMFGMF